ncbi:MAG: hypothetical protein M3Q58_10820 [Bacteroidota bacterium]|nr:hypothetical protein [Bacteroidota bacterium]
MTLNLVSLIILSLAGLAIILYALLKRLRKEKKEPPYDPTKDDPIIHIRNNLFLEIPIEKILFGYFIVIALIYIGKLIFAQTITGLNLTVLYLSGLIFLLIVYKMVMIVEVAKKFNPWMLFSALFSGLIFLIVYNQLDINIVDLLRETREYNLTIHLFGLVLGLGGTLVVDIMFTHFLRNYRISARESVIMHLISQMIILGLILLLISGLTLVLPFHDTFLNSSRFLMKMTVVLVIILNGIALNLYLTPQLKKISLIEGEKGREENLKRISFALGGISIVSWLSAFLLAMLKETFTLPYITLLIGYLFLMLIAIAGSQMAKKYYETKKAEENKRN